MKSSVLLQAAFLAASMACRPQITWSAYRYITTGLKDKQDSVKGRKARVIVSPG